MKRFTAFTAFTTFTTILTALISSTLLYAAVTESTFATRPAPGKEGNYWRQSASDGPLRCTSDGTDWLCEAYGVNVSANPVPSSGWDTSLAGGSTIDFTGGVGRITVPGGGASWLPLLHPVGETFNQIECLQVSKPQGIVAGVLADSTLTRFIYFGQTQDFQTFTQYYSPQNSFAGHLTNFSSGATGQQTCFSAFDNGVNFGGSIGRTPTAMGKQFEFPVETTIGSGPFEAAYFGVVFYRYGFPFELNAELFHYPE